MWRKKFHSAAFTVGINPLNPNTVYAVSDSGKVYVSYDRGDTWNYWSSPGLLSSIREILVHTSDTLVVFCAAASELEGLRKSTDYGLTWRTVISRLGIDGESITYDPTHPDTMYAGNFQDAKVYRSTDRGETWEFQGLAGRTNLCALAVRPDSSNILYAGTGSGTISKSTDSGLTWRVVKASYGAFEIPRIVVGPSNPLVGYAALLGGLDTSAGIFKTVDGGEHWLPTSLTKIPMWAMEINPFNENIAYAGAWTNQVTSIFETTDGGSSWRSLSTGLHANGYVWSLKIHPTEPAQVWASVTRGSVGAGEIYRLGTLTATIHGVVFDGATSDIVTTGILTIAGSDDNTDLRRSRGQFIHNYFDVDPSPPVAHVEAFPFYIKDVALSLDSTVSQNIFLDKLPSTFIEGEIRDSSTQHPLEATVTVTARTSYGSVDLSANDDSTGYFRFDNIPLPYPQLISNYSLVADPELPFAQLQISSLHVDSAGLYLSMLAQPADVLVVGEDSADYRSYYRTTLGALGLRAAIWNSVTKGPAPFQRGKEFKKNSVVYFSGTKQTPLSAEELSNLVSCLNAGCNLFLTGQNIVEKNDTSELFRNLLGVKFAGNTENLGAYGGTADLFSGLAFLTFGSDGANNQISRDSLWITPGPSKPVLTYGDDGIAAIRVDSVGAGGKVVLMGFGFEAVAGARTRKTIMQRVMGYFDGTIVLEIGDLHSLPEAIRLEQNYPNPFNPVTIINYQLPIDNWVTLKVYNLLGQEVEALVNGMQNAGYKSVSWDASGAASGVYICRLQTRAFAATRKLILLR